MARRIPAPHYTAEGEQSRPAEPQRATDEPLAAADDGSLFEQRDAEEFQRRWTDLQVSFVDDPRSAVEQADELVAEVMKRITATFEAQRMLLERQWGEGQQASTEDLRVALQRYRSFFQRLLSF